MVVRTFIDLPMVSLACTFCERSVRDLVNAFDGPVEFRVRIGLTMALFIRASMGTFRTTEMFSLRCVRPNFPAIFVRFAIDAIAFDGEGCFLTMVPVDVFFSTAADRVCRSGIGSLAPVFVVSPFDRSARSLCRRSSELCPTWCVLTM